MGKRGPKPKPPALDRLDGNPSRRPKGDGVLAQGQPTCPAYLGSYARAVWKRIAASMPERLYAQADRELLAAYCATAQQHKEATETLQREGTVVVTSKGDLVESPWSKIRDRQAQKLATLGTRLGLDPSARAALHLPADDAPQASRLGQLIAIQGGRSGS